MNSVSDVTVVIPTTGRSSVGEALRSVLRQTVPPSEIILVADMSRSDPRLADLHKLLEQVEDESIVERLRLVTTGGGGGGGGARMLGTVQARSTLISYLDDDDVFTETKLEHQTNTLHRVAMQGGRHLVASRCIYRFEDGSEEFVPRQIYSGGDVADYLFCGRSLRASRNLVPTPTWLMNRDTALLVGWRSELKRHQDWDFLLRAQAQHQVVIHQTEEVTAIVNTESDSSITSNSDFAASHAWAASVRHLMSERAYADFLVGQPVRYALQARRFSAAKMIMREARQASPPSLSAYALALSGLVSRRRFSQLMAYTAGRKGRSSE